VPFSPTPFQNMLSDQIENQYSSNAYANRKEIMGFLVEFKMMQYRFG